MPVAVRSGDASNGGSPEYEPLAARASSGDSVGRFVTMQSLCREDSLDRLPLVDADDDEVEGDALGSR